MRPRTVDPLENRRKHLSDVNRHDLILKWKLDDADGHSYYDIHMLAEYQMGKPPLGSIMLRPGKALASITWSSAIDMESRLMSAQVRE